jgi:hypothetical protein
VLLGEQNEDDVAEPASAGHTESEIKADDKQLQTVKPDMSRSDDLSLRANLYGVLFQSYIDEVKNSCVCLVF